MSSVIVNVGIEVEVFYGEDFEPLHAVVQTAGLPLPVDQYAKVIAINKFEQDPLACIAGYERANAR